MLYNSHLNRDRDRKSHADIDPESDPERMAIMRITCDVMHKIQEYLQRGD
jgi:hypothetical protein